jgi:hypothetical protein
MGFAKSYFTVERCSQTTLHSEFTCATDTWRCVRNTFLAKSVLGAVDEWFLAKQNRLLTGHCPLSVAGCAWMPANDGDSNNQRQGSWVAALTPLKSDSQLELLSPCYHHHHAHTPQTGRPLDGDVCAHGDDVCLRRRCRRGKGNRHKFDSLSSS